MLEKTSDEDTASTDARPIRTTRPYGRSMQSTRDDDTTRTQRRSYCSICQGYQDQHLQQNCKESLQELTMA
eukprot:1609126-Amphidinium_carterae.1